MTDHPLTDEMIQEIGRSVGGCEFNDSCHDEMRSAYDLAIRRSAEWMKENLDCYTYTFDGAAEIDYDNLFKDFKKAMRPQREDN